MALYRRLLSAASGPPCSAAAAGSFPLKGALNKEQMDKVRVMLRIDLAGEVAANRIYQGQKHGLRNDKATVGIIEEMHAQERRHLTLLKRQSRQYNVQPSKLTLLAHGLSYCVGI